MHTPKIVKSHDSLNKLHIELMKVFNQLNILNYEFSIDFDGFSPIFLYNYKFILSSPIT